MKDRVPLYPGRVKLLPVAGQENTYDMVRADSPTQEGTPLNKATLLTDETAKNINLKQSDPTVNDALIAIFDRTKGMGDHLWAKCIWENPTEEQSDVANFRLTGAGDNNNLTTTWEYSESIILEPDLNGGVKASLSNPATVEIANTSGSTGTEAAEILKGKYCHRNWPSDNTLYFVPPTATISLVSGNGWWVQTDIIYAISFSGGIIGVERILHGYEGEYASGEREGYNYVYLGDMHSLFPGSKIAVGSYQGTGMYGATNPCTLTFDFTPKFLIIKINVVAENYGDPLLLCFWGKTTTIYFSKSSSATTSELKNTVTYTGNTISWYNKTSASYQGNSSASAYHYIAVG